MSCISPHWLVWSFILSILFQRFLFFRRGLSAFCYVFERVWHLFQCLVVKCSGMSVRRSSVWSLDVYPYHLIVMWTLFGVISCLRSLSTTCSSFIDDACCVFPVVESFIAILFKNVRACLNTSVVWFVEDGTGATLSVEVLFAIPF